MTSCQCQGIEREFSERYVASDLRRYRRAGPSRSTRMLTEALSTEGLAGGTLLDIGGGVGAIPHRLLAAGMQTATCVDASSAYSDAARREAQRRGLDNRVRLLQGDFVELAAQVGEHDVVTLDRVICCYDDIESLVRLSGARARRLLGLVYPRDHWLARLIIHLLNAVMRLRGSPFRNYVHSSERLEALLEGMGFTRHFTDRTLIWQVRVYQRSAAPRGSGPLAGIHITSSLAGGLGRAWHKVREMTASWRAFWKSRLDRLADLVAEPGDDPEIRLRKALLIRVSLLIILAAALWGVLYLIFSEPLAGAIPLSYGVFSLLTLLVLLATRRFDLYLASQLVLIVLLPFLLMVALGGFVNSSAVVLWSVLCPMAALVFDQPEKSPRWLLLYFGLLVLGGILQPYVRLTNNLPPTMIVPLFFVLNIGTVSGIAFFLLYYFVREKNRAYQLLNMEQERSEQLLLNVLPREVAPRLKEAGQTVAEHFDSASVLFADIVGSTTLFADMEPREIVDWLNEVFSAFDVLLEKFGLEKIRTIGDNYMVASGVPRPRPDHARALALMALEMCELLDRMPERDGRRIAFRMGMNSGPMVGGVIGKTKFHYDLWGDTVNTASRMESHGEVGKIQVTEQTYDLLKGEFEFEPRGPIPVKGKGEMQTWFLLGRRQAEPGPAPS